MRLHPLLAFLLMRILSRKLFRAREGRFLDQNISLLLFFIGRITEICYIATFGAEKNIENLQKLYDLFALNNPQLENDFTHTPLFQRSEIYSELGFIDETIKLKTEIDINTVIILTDS